ncbi:MAG TPA: hypothetical protein VFZ65_14645 [Planctomycetota bacterium]|nr:hypothetical protein [Planctomycetota bacterium]
MTEHERLLALVPRRREDYQPWGDDDRDEPYGPDCSCGCRFARWLADTANAKLGLDWCVCTNPASHRCGLLTFEHQGCRAFEPEPD